MRRTNEVLERWLEYTSGMEAAVIIADSGQVEAWAAPAEVEADLAPLFTMLADVADRTARGLGRGGLCRLIIEGDHGTVAVRELEDGRILGLLAKRSVSLGVLLQDAESLTTRVTARRV